MSDTIEKGAYRIGSIEGLTGLSPHVIRSWERRYGVDLASIRSPGGARLFTDKDVELLRLRRRLVEAGMPPANC